MVMAEKRLNKQSDNSPKSTQSKTLQKRQVGRPSDYTPQKADNLCSLISGGKSLATAAKELKLTRPAIYRWLAEEATFRNNYGIAMQERADYLFEELDDYEQMLIREEMSVGVFRSIVDKRKWQLARMSPKKYGDTNTIDIKGTINTNQSLKDTNIDTIKAELKNRGIDVDNLS